MSRPYARLSLAIDAARRTPPAIPPKSRFVAGERAHIKSTRFSFEVSAVSSDGETLTARDGTCYEARYCERTSSFASELPSRRPSRTP